jgi:hypothetical protein
MQDKDIITAVFAGSVIMEGFGKVFAILFEAFSRQDQFGKGELQGFRPGLETICAKSLGKYLGNLSGDHAQAGECYRLGLLYGWSLLVWVCWKGHHDEYNIIK